MQLFVGILLLQQVTKNQIRLNLCNLLQQQNSIVATIILPRILSTHGAILSLQHVAATCRLVYYMSGPLIIRQESMNIYFSWTTQQHFFQLIN